MRHLIGRWDSQLGVSGSFDRVGINRVNKTINKVSETLNRVSGSLKVSTIAGSLADINKFLTC